MFRERSLRIPSRRCMKLSSSEIKFLGDSGSRIESAILNFNNLENPYLESKNFE